MKFKKSVFICWFLFLSINLFACGGSDSDGNGNETDTINKTSVEIINSSFEDDQGTLGCSNANPITGWTTSSGVGNLLCNQGIFNPTASNWFTTGLDGTGSAWLNSSGYLSQKLTDSLEENMDYTLSSYVGVRSGNGSGSHSWSIQLLANEVLLAETTGIIGEVDHGLLTKVSVNYSSEAIVTTGQVLEIRLVLLGNGFNPQLAFDLVTLSKNSSIK